MTQPFVEADDIKRVGALRRWLLEHGASPARLHATPSDIARFDLTRWDGMFCGVVCVDSAIAVVAR